MGSDSLHTNAKYVRETEAIGRCDHCDKLTFLTRKAARAFARAQHPGEHKTPYVCPDNESHWHYGLLADGVVAGRVSRRAAYRRGTR